MPELTSYPKVYNLGHRLVAGILDHPVQIQEKVDGSQFSFGKLNGLLQMRSRRQPLHPGNPVSGFQGAMETAQRLFGEGRLVEGWIYRGESMQKPRQNSLTYGDVPVGNLVLFDAHRPDGTPVGYNELIGIATNFSIELVPQLGVGMFGLETLKRFLDVDSFLGNVKIEGIVIKTFNPTHFIQDPYGEGVLWAKLVRDDFRELNDREWRKSSSKQAKKTIVVQLAEAVGTDRRFEKGLEALRDAGTYKGGPEDIGPLMAHVQQDIEAETVDWLKDKLWGHFKKDILRSAASRAPEWRKARLLEENVEGVR